MTRTSQPGFTSQPSHGDRQAAVGVVGNAGGNGAAGGNGRNGTSAGGASTSASVNLAPGAGAAPTAAAGLPFARLTGLSAEEVAQAQAAGQTNVDAGIKTRSVQDILAGNILTLFNLVNVVLFALVLSTGSLKNGLFMIVIVLNTAIGIVQEIRSKRVTDRLSILASSKAKVIRAGQRQEIAQDAIVKGDCLILGRGDQVPCDSTVLDGNARLDESLLTGESNLIPKTAGDTLMSGSFVSSGLVAVKVEHVGADNYAAQITAEAKKHKPVTSEIMKSLNAIIKFVSIAIIPVGLLLYCSTHFFYSTAHVPSLLTTVAALVGMVPEGLILLTSTVLALAVIRLSRRNVLVQQLYCIETLARVDTLCLDKTGTITSGAMVLSSVVLLDKNGQAAQRLLEDPDGTASAGGPGNPGGSPGNTGSAGGPGSPGNTGSAGVPGSRSSLDGAAAEILRAIHAVAHADPDPNETGQALIKGLDPVVGGSSAGIASYVPFSSERKWSAATLDSGQSYVMGAAQFIMDKESFKAVEQAVGDAAADARVLLLARVEAVSEDSGITGIPEPLALVCIRDEIRASAAQTIAYFKEQGVDVKVISGDDPKTVAGIARKVGVPDAGRYVDAGTLDTGEKLANAINDYHVFGRVKPEQKHAFVKALQARGHIVAMTGDGVNDTLALKESDCSVAMAAGSDAARNVSQLVLVDNDFASMPRIVAEGRRSINNLQRSASLFLIKTFFSMALALLFIFLPWQYPYQPIQMTLVSAFTIGLPSFVLALEPNRDRIKGHFLENVIVRSIPGSVSVVLMDLFICITGYLLLDLHYTEVSTMCVIVTAWIGLNLIFRISLPFTPMRLALIIAIAGGFTLGILFFPGIFSIARLTTSMLLGAAVFAALGSVVFHLVYNAFDRWHARRQKQLV